MTSRTHDVFAFASLTTVAVTYPPTSLNVITFTSSLVGCIIGSLLPDIDQASNRLWDLIPAGHLVGKLARIILRSHRTLSHSLLGIFLFYKVIGLILFKLLNPAYINIDIVYTSIMVGFLSHLLLDSFTEEGLPLFFPIKWKIGFPPIASWRIKTGKWFEKFIVFPGIIVYLFWFVINNQEKFIQILKLVIN